MYFCRKRIERFLMKGEALEIFFAMKTREKIDRAADITVLCLHKEGIFYKLYKQHAMLFTANINWEKSLLLQCGGRDFF